MLQRIKSQRDLTVLITTHYMDEADKLCDRIAIVDHGKLVALDSPGALKASIPGRDPDSVTLDDVFVHYTGRDLRDALQEPSAADSPFMIGSSEDDDVASLGHHRTRAAAVPSEPDADRHVDDLPADAADRARLRVRWQRQAPQAGGRRSGRRRAGGEDPRARRAVSSGARTLDLVDYTDQGIAMTDLRNGRVNGVLTIPPDFSRRSLTNSGPRVALISDNTDNFVSATLAGTVSSFVGALNAPTTPVRVEGGRSRRRRGLSLRAVHPVPAAWLDHHVDLHDGDDRRRHHLHRRQARGLHEGYLVTPITKLELVAGFNLSGTIKAVWPAR